MTTREAYTRSAEAWGNAMRETERFVDRLVAGDPAGAEQHKIKALAFVEASFDLMTQIGRAQMEARGHGGR